MHIQLPMILWHGSKERILSLDFHPFTNELVTGGSDEYNPKETSQADGFAKIWEVNEGEKELVQFRYGLQGHSSNVNAVKFSPNGRYLATASDDKMIVIWQVRDNFLSTGSTQRLKRWSSKYSLSGHLSEVIDIKWSSNSKYLVSAGMDKRIIVWLVEKCRYERILDEHNKFVQGIAVDAKFHYIVSMSNDRSAKVWKNSNTKKTQVAFFSYKTFKKIDFPKGEKERDSNEESDHNAAGFKMFFDDTVPTFFRRPDISPDGQLYLLPSGQWQRTPESNPQHCAFLFRKHFLERPSFYIETRGEPSICARFCPNLFQKSDPTKGLFRQPYYMVFAIATFHTVLVYSTDNLAPICAMGNYHFAAITELSWKGSSLLGMSSSDGYCSFMAFGKDELGTEHEGTFPHNLVLDEQLKSMLARQPYQPPKEQTVTQAGETQVILREENNQIKKSIVPVMVQRF